MSDWPVPWPISVPPKLAGAGTFLYWSPWVYGGAYRHLGLIWQPVIGEAGAQLDADEILSYRAVFCGMVFGPICEQFTCNVA